MKILYSINNEARPVNFFKNEDGNVFIKLSDKPTVKDCLGLYEEGINTYLKNPGNLLDQHNIVLVTSDAYNNLNIPMFQHVETQHNKLNEKDFFRYKFNRSNDGTSDGFLYTVSKIYIPFKDSTYEDYLYRVKIQEADVEKLLKVFPDAEEILHENPIIFKWIADNLPKLKVIETLKSGEFTKIKVQLTLGGNNCEKSGVRIFAKSANGYIASREVYTDENGVAEFKATRYGLDNNDTMTVEFGFKYFSNIVSENITS
jgi:hypothetical protein